MSDTLSEQIRRAVRDSGMNAHQLEIHSTVNRAVIGRFLAAERDLRLGTAERLLKAIDAEVEVYPPSGRRVNVERPRSTNQGAR